MSTLRSILIFVFFFITSSCNSQTKDMKFTNRSQSAEIDRHPAVAGQFFPIDKNELRDTI